MTSPSGPLGDEYAADRSSGQWLQLVLFGIGGLLFLGGLVAAGIPGAPFGMPVADEGGTPTAAATETPPVSPTPPATDAAASPTRQSTATAAPATATSQPTRRASRPGQVVYRINVGGPRLRASGNGPAWSSDRDNSPSRYLNARESDTVVSGTPDNVTRDDGVPKTVPRAMFKTYRFERGADKPRYEEMVWRFPVDSDRRYEVRLYVVEAFFTRGPPQREGERRYRNGGPRTFGIAIENRTVLRNYEPIDAHGHDVGGVRTFDATAEDGTLTVRFLREQENPTVSGIEIVDTGPRNDRGSPSATARGSPTGTRDDRRQTQSGPNARTRHSPTKTAGGGGQNGTNRTTASPPPTPTGTEDDSAWWE